MSLLRALPILLFLPLCARAQDYAKISDACPNEIGLLCAKLQGKKLLACLDDNGDSLTSACRTELRAQEAAAANPAPPPPPPPAVSTATVQGKKPVPPAKPATTPPPPPPPRP